MNPSEWDGTSVREALTLSFVILMNDCYVRADEPNFGHFCAHKSRGGIPRICVETAEKCLDRVGPYPTAAERINPQRVRGVYRPLSVSIVRTLGFGSELNHVKNRDAIRTTLTCKIAGQDEAQYKNRSGKTHNLSMHKAAEEENQAA